MSLRLLILSLIVAGVSAYAWRDWFKALCGAVVLMAFLEHPDMPKNILGIQGVNLWNILLVNVLIGWMQQRGEEGWGWDVPKSMKVALALYCSVIVWSFSRFLIDPSSYYSSGRLGIAVDYLINPLKFLIPGLLFLDGCRTRERVLTAATAIICLYA